MKALVLIFLVALTSPAWAQPSIGVYAEPDPVRPVESDPPEPVLNGLQLPTQVPTPVYIVAHTNGSSALPGGILGAEFGIQIDPPNADLFIGNVEANPAANFELGNPFLGGTNISFPSCQAPSQNDAILLYSAVFVALADLPQTTVNVTPHANPSNPIFEDILLLRCSGPVDPRVPSTSVPLVINPIVAVESETWSAIKQQFR